MATPSQDLIVCKGCGKDSEPHPKRRFYCVPCTRKLHVAYTAKHREKLKATPQTVKCQGCGEQFTTEKSGKKWRCAECMRLYLLERRQKDQYRHNVYSKVYRERLGDEYRARMRKRRDDVIKSLPPDELVEFRKEESERSKRASAKVKDDVFNAYGGYKCACCGETERVFLSIDHIYNDGHILRRNGVHGRSATAFYRWIRMHNYPPGFQVLCMNCNVGKHRNGGVCPHQSSKV